MRVARIFLVCAALVGGCGARTPPRTSTRVDGAASDAAPGGVGGAELHHMVFLDSCDQAPNQVLVHGILAFFTSGEVGPVVLQLSVSRGSVRAIDAIPSGNALLVGPEGVEIALSAPGRAELAPARVLIGDQSEEALEYWALIEDVELPYRIDARPHGTFMQARLMSTQDASSVWLLGGNETALVVARFEIGWQPDAPPSYLHGPDSPFDPIVFGAQVVADVQERGLSSADAEVIRRQLLGLATGREGLRDELFYWLPPEARSGVEVDVGSIPVRELAAARVCLGPRALP